MRPVSTTVSPQPLQTAGSQVSPTPSANIYAVPTTASDAANFSTPVGKRQSISNPFQTNATTEMTPVNRVAPKFGFILGGLETIPIFCCCCCCALPIAAFIALLMHGGGF